MTSTTSSLSVFIDASARKVAQGAIAPYAEQFKAWPTAGRHLLAYSDSEGVVVYQAFNEGIASYAATHQTFVGCPLYNPTRMTWIKTSFMWMMYRCAWGLKDRNQERVLALKVSHEGFAAILSQAATEGKGTTSTVRLQWDPDHAPSGASLSRRAIQLGLKGDMAVLFTTKYVIRIEDVTDTLVKAQWPLVLPSMVRWMKNHKAEAINKNDWSESQQKVWSRFLESKEEDASVEADESQLQCPLETPYALSEELTSHLNMHDNEHER